MKLVFCLFKYFPFGGLQRDFLRIATLCQQRGHDITVFTQTWQGAIPPSFHINVLPLRSVTSHGKCREFAQLVLDQLKKERYDVVVGFNKMPGLDLYYAADPCYQHRMRGTLRSWYGLSPRYRTFVALESAVFSTQANADILLIAPAQQSLFARYYHTQPERFHLLSPGIAKDRIAPTHSAEIRADFRREFAIQPDEHVVLMVGTGFKRKGVDRMLRALASLPAEARNKTRLMVLGEDDPRPYTRMAKSLGILERVSLLGGREDVPRFLLGTDLLAHPAYSENTGTVLLEALASGLPVLVTEVCGYAFHIAQAKAGQIVSSPFQQEELNRRLHEMLTSRERDTWRANALRYAMTTDLYSMPDQVVKLIEVKGASKAGAVKT